MTWVYWGLEFLGAWTLAGILVCLVWWGMFAWRGHQAKAYVQRALNGDAKP
jgi:thiamine transporter ThiT